MRKLRRVCQRLSTMMDTYESPPLGRVPKGKRKPGVNKRERSNFKYGLEIPIKYADAVRIDIANGNT